MTKTYKKPYQPDLVVGASIRDGLGRNIANNIDAKANKKDVLSDVSISTDMYLESDIISKDENNKLVYSMTAKVMNDINDIVSFASDKLVSATLFKNKVSEINDKISTSPKGDVTVENEIDYEE